jgi:hypothetical protein
MTDIPKDAPPPYFNINPDVVLAELDAPVSTQDFEVLATRCARGRDDLIARGHERDGHGLAGGAVRVAGRRGAGRRGRGARRGFALLLFVREHLVHAPSFHVISTVSGRK